MAIKHYYTILCDQIIEAKDGKNSLIGIYQRVQLARLPGGLIRMWAYLEMDGDEGDKLEVSVEDADGAQVAVLGQATITAEMLAGSRDTGQEEATLAERMRVTTVAGPVFFKRFGPHFVVLKEGSRVVDRHRFEVVQQSTGG